VLFLAHIPFVKLCTLAIMHSMLWDCEASTVVCLSQVFQ